LSILCFIPARAGSKSIKNKNLYKINSKPLIYYTIKFAQKIKNNFIFVSTDSTKILKYTNKLNLNNKYIRPKKLSGDHSLVIDALIDSLNWLKKKGKFFNTVILLQPTNPVRNIIEFNKALAIFKKKKLDSLVSVTRMREHPYECIEIKKDNSFQFLKKNPDKKSTNRQGYNKNFFFIDGNFYIAKVSFLLKHKKFINKKKTKFFIQKSVWPIDIDYLEDIKVAKNFL
jgi:CMP-N-acetylneuraminic acid synthetase